MGRRLAVEKEVILIIDEGGVEAYDEAMLSDSLSWHWISVHAVDISDSES
jgi:hypothetical protein